MLDFAPGLWSYQSPAPVAGAPAVPLTSSLTDNFNDNSMDVTKWALGQICDPTATTTGVTVAETSGQVQVTGAGVSALRLSGYLSVNQYKLQGDSFFLKVPNLASMASSNITWIAYGADANNNYRISLGPASVQIHKRVAGTDTTLASVAPGSNVWFRVRESAGKIWLDGAPATASNPPISTDWTNLTSGAEDGALSVASGYINFGSGTWESSPAGTVMQFDGFNTGT